jgi:hypothetical protein
MEAFGFEVPLAAVAKHLMRIGGANDTRVQDVSILALKVARRLCAYKCCATLFARKRACVLGGMLCY